MIDLKSMYIVYQHVQHTAGNLGYCFIWKLEKRTQHSNNDYISRNSTLGGKVVRNFGDGFMRIGHCVPIYWRNQIKFYKI